MKNKNRKARNAYAPAMNANWLQRIGVAGFTFFLAKGLLWIVAVTWAVYY